jgi:hypothetical protein
MSSKPSTTGSTISRIRLVFAAVLAPCPTATVFVLARAAGVDDVITVVDGIGSIGVELATELVGCCIVVVVELARPAVVDDVIIDVVGSDVTVEGIGCASVELALCTAAVADIEIVEAVVVEVDVVVVEQGTPTLPAILQRCKSGNLEKF